MDDAEDRRTAAKGARGAASRDWGAVLRAVAGGAAAALEIFYEEHADGLYTSVFYRVGQDEAMAEDVVGDTFPEAAERAERFDATRNSPASWLRSLSRDVIRRHVFAARKGSELLAVWDRIDPSLAQAFDALGKSPLGEEIIEREQTRALVKMAVASLPEHDRRALRLEHLEGESVASIAERAALTEDAAKSLLARARRALRAALLAVCRSLAEAGA